LKSKKSTMKGFDKKKKEEIFFSFTEEIIMLKCVAFSFR